jgi:hypothetical protein
MPCIAPALPYLVGDSASSPHCPPPPSHTVSGVAPNSLPPYMQSLMDPNKGASRMSDEAWEEEGNEDEGGTGRLLEEGG